MKKTGLIVAVGALALAGAALYFFGGAGDAPPVVVTLVPGPPQPRITPAEAGIDPAALAAAATYAAERNTRALIVAHNGHVVFEQYWGDTNADTPVEMSGFTPVLAAIALGSMMNDRLIVNLDAPLTDFTPAAPPERATLTLRQLLMREGDLPADEAADLLALALTKVAGQGYDVVVAERVWKPLGAGEFSLEARGTDDPLGNVRAGCCMSARLGDWLRVGQLLVDRGVFEGNELAPPNYVKLMLSATHPQATGGYFTRVDGQFAARDLVWLEAEGKQRLWMIPSLDLAILRAGSEPPAAAGWDEALIPDSIVRGMRDWRPLPAGEEADLNRFAPH